MGKTHTSILRRFGYHPATIRRMVCFIRKTEGIKYFQHENGNVVAKCSKGVWRHCDKNGIRIGDGRRGVGRGHGPDELEELLTKFYRGIP